MIVLKTYNGNGKDDDDDDDDDDHDENDKNDKKDGVNENNGNQRCVFQRGVPKIFKAIICGSGDPVYNETWKNLASQM